MATTDPVEIVVDIIDSFSDELTKLETFIEKIDRESADFRVVADIDEASVARVQGVKSLLSKDVHPNVRFGSGMFPSSQLDMLGMRGAGSPDIDFDIGRRLTRRGAFGRQMERLRERWAEFGRTLLRYRPSIMDWWNVLALLIPILITLAGAAVGLIAALGGVATAAVGIVGIGLLGWGDSATESFENLKMEARALGSELFDTLRPAAAALQPVLENAMAATPGLVENLVDELSALRAFAPGLGEIGGGFMEWVETSLQLINVWRDEIIFAALEVGRGLGTFIQDFLVFGLDELVKNIDAYENLAAAFVDFLRALFEISKAVSFTIAQFAPLFQLASDFAQLLSSPLTTAMLTFATAVFFGVGALANFSMIWSFLAGMKLVQFLNTWSAGFIRLAATIAGVNTQLSLMRRLLLASGVGIIALGAGALALRAFDASTNAPGSGGASVTNINIEGDVGRRQMHDIKDIFGNQFGNHSNARSVMRGPNG